MDMTTMISLAVLVVLVGVYVARRRARLRREDLD